MECPVALDERLIWNLCGESTTPSIVQVGVFLCGRSIYWHGNSAGSQQKEFVEKEAVLMKAMGHAASCKAAQL
jgi:hypothetical protein